MTEPEANAAVTLLGGDWEAGKLASGEWFVWNGFRMLTEKGRGGAMAGGVNGDRFRVVWSDELTPEQLEIHGEPLTDFYCAIIDTQTGEIIGTDRAEPEDKILVRDFGWVHVELNRLAREIMHLNLQIAALRGTK